MTYIYCKCKQSPGEGKAKRAGAVRKDRIQTFLVPVMGSGDNNKKNAALSFMAAWNNSNIFCKLKTLHITELE